MLLLRFFAAVLCLLAGPAWAQTDTILRTNGEEVKGRVLTVSPLEVSYVAAANDTLRLPAASVFLIRYANGTKELIQQLAPPAAAAEGPLVGLSSSQRTARGQADASKGYRGGGGLVAGIAGSTLFCGPFLGLIPVVVISQEPVKERNLGAPVPDLMRDPEYAAAYRQQANATKRRRAWTGYGVGVGIQVVLLAALIASLQQ